MEPRVVLDADPGNVFAQFGGTITAENPIGSIPFEVNSENFLSSRGTQVLGFRVDPAGDSSFDPAAAQIRSSGGATYPLNYSTDDLVHSSSSLIVVEVPAGNYTLEISPQDDSVGDYRVTASLAGDLNGDGTVQLDDRAALVRLLRARSYALEADVNLDGYLTSFDTGHLLRNLGVSTSIEPLSLTAQLSPGADVVLGDGSEVTGIVSHSVHGETNANTEVSLQLGDQPEVEFLSDESGVFSSAITLGEGINPIAITATDSFGQQATTTLDIVLDTTPPSLSLELADASDTEPRGDSSTTLDVVTVQGVTEPGLTVELFRDGDLTSIVDSATADESGNYQFSGQSLAIGTNLLTAVVSDVVGNTSQSNLEVVRVSGDDLSPDITLTLVVDTGSDDSDRITSDPRISALVFDQSEIALVRAALDGESSGSFIDVTPHLQPGGELDIDEPLLESIFGGTLADGAYTLRLEATDQHDNVSKAVLTLQLDRTTPVASILTPPDGTITNLNISVVGQVTDTGSGVFTLQSRRDSSAYTNLGFDPEGNFLFETATSVDSSDDGSHTIDVRATDVAGNVSLPVSITYVLDTIAPTGEISLSQASDTGDLGDGVTSQESVRIEGQTEPGIGVELLTDGRMTISDAGGAFAFDNVQLVDGANLIEVEMLDAAGNQSTISTVVTLESDALVLTEGSDFTVVAEFPITVPNAPAHVQLTYSGLTFDTRDDFINDAFEIALVDGQGRSLVHTINRSADAAFNLTEGESVALGANTQHDAATVKIDMSHLSAGTEATLIARLVNNDTDTTTTVSISSVEVVDGSLHPVESFVMPAAPAFARSTDPMSERDDLVSGFDAATSTTLGLNAVAVVNTIEEFTGWFDVSGDGSRLYVAAQDGALHVIDTSSGDVIKEISLNNSALVLDVVESHDGARIFVSMSKGAGSVATDGHNAVVIIDAATYEIIGSVPIGGHELGPAGIAESPDGQELFVTHRFDSRTIVIDIPAAQEVASVPTPTEPVNLAVTPDGTRVYVGARRNNTLHAIDADSRQVFATLELPFVGTGGGLDICISPDGTRLYSTLVNKSGIAVFDVDPASPTYHQQVDLIGTDATASTLATLAFGENGKILHFLNRATPQLFVIDTDPESPTYHQTLASIRVGDVPQGLAIPDSRSAVAFVSTQGTSRILEIDVPQFEIDAKLPTEAEAGTALLLQGQVLAESTIEIAKNGSIKETISRITSVTINGRPVAVVDALGNFFQQITVAPGQNAFEIEATNALGQTATKTLTVQGIQPKEGEIDFSVISDVTGSLSGEYGRTSLNAETNTLFTNLAIRNDGAYPADVPLLVGIANLSDPSVRVRGFDGQTPDGLPYFDVSTLVDGRTLSPDEATGARSISFYNPNATQFTYDMVFLGKLNQAPIISTVPDIGAFAERAYSYDVNASDPDGDSLSYSLSVAPASMQIDAQTGLITWSPATSDIGNFEVTVRVEDGRGGTTEQRYLLSTVAAPPNRPPHFTSIPVVDVQLGEEYSYDAKAVDPDEDPLEYVLLDGPEGAAIDPATGDVTWPPTADQIEVAAETSDDSGFLVEQYASVTSPVGMAFAPDGTLFVGSAFAPDGSDDGFAHIRRISRGGTVVEDFGPAITDPDSVAVDVAGTLSGVPGSVLIGGNDATTAARDGQITAIHPDGTSNVLVGPTTTFIDPQLVFDGSGRFIIADTDSTNVFVSDGGAPQLLMTLPERPSRVAVGSGGKVYVNLNSGTTQVYSQDGQLIDAEFYSGLLSSIAIGPGDSVWGDDLYAIDYINDALLRFDKSGSSRVVVNGIDGNPSAISFGPDGALYVSMIDRNEIIRISATREPLGLEPNQHRVLLAASDGRGGVATQEYTISVQPDPENHDPVILSEPATTHILTSVSEGGSSIQIDATVRDLRLSHPDFEAAIPGHVTGLVEPVLGPDHKPVFAGPDGRGAITSSQTFDQWYRDVAGVNAPYALTLKLDETTPGSKTYSFSDTSFFPIDNMLYGNEDLSHNYSFTLEMNSTFTYRGGEVFQFVGDDDVWVFIDDQLVIDLGGVHGPISGTVAVDTLGLTIGESYRLDLFFAERHTSGSSFTVQTGISLTTDEPYEYQIVASDADADALEFTLVSGPQGMVVDAGTGRLSWSPAASDIGPHDVTVRVEDGRGGFDEQSFTIDVVEGGNGEIRGQKFEDANGDGLQSVRLLSVDQSTNELLSIDPASGTVQVIGPLQYDWVNLSLAMHEDRLFAVDGRLDGVFLLEIDLASGNVMSTTQVTYQGNPILHAEGLSSDGSNLFVSFNLTASNPRISDSLGQLSVDGEISAARTFSPQTDFDDFDVNADGSIIQLDAGPPTDLNENSMFQISEDLASRDLLYQLPLNQYEFNDFVVNGDQHLLVDTTNAQIVSVDTANLNAVSVISLPNHAPFGLAIAPVDVGLAGWTIYLDDNNNGLRDPDERFTTTDVEGNYEFTGLQEGTYFVREEPQDGWVQTSRGNAATLIKNGDFELTDFTRNADFTRQYSGWREVRVWDGQGSAAHAGIGLEGTNNLSSEYILSTRFDGFDAAAPDPFFPYEDETDPQLDHFGYARPSGRARTSSYSELISDPFVIDGPITMDVWRENAGSDSEVRFHDALTDELLDSFVVTDGVREWTTVTFDTSNHVGRQAYIVLHGGTTQSGYGWLTLFDNVFGGRTGAELAKDFAQKVVLSQGELVEDVDFGNRFVGGGKNQRPFFKSTPPESVGRTETLDYRARAGDPNGDQLTYDLVVAPEGMAIDAEQGIVVWQPRLEDLGVHDVILRVRDGRGGVDLQSFEITVTDNTAPVITSTPNLQAADGLPYEYQVRSQDSDGDAITYRLDAAPDGMQIDPQTGLISWAAATGVTHPVVVVATDTRGLSDEQEYSLSVLGAPVNNDPTFLSQPRTRIQLGARYQYVVQVSDPDADPLSVSLDQAPAGMTLDGRTLLWTPTSDDIGVDHPVQLTVSDGRDGSAVQSFTVSVVPQKVNAAPVITSTPLATVIAGQRYSYDATAEDADNDPLLWNLIQGPRGMSIDAQTGSLRWTPELSQLGSHDVVIETLDGQGGTTEQRFRVEVRAINSPPLIRSTPPTEAFVDRLLQYQVDAFDVDGDTLQFVKAGPPNMVIDLATGLLSWTPTADQIGTHTIGVRVTDGQAAVDQWFDVVVGLNAPNDPPIISTTPGFVATVDETYSYDVDAIDPNGDPLTYSLIDPPAGMQIDPQTGLISWIPTTLGTASVTVAVKDPFGAGVGQRYALTVKPTNNPPTIDSVAIENVTTGGVYRYNVLASDLDDDSLRFVLSGQPDGMTVDPQNGRIRWDVAAGVEGTFPFEINVNDGRGGIATQSVNLVVGPDVSPPQVQVGL